MNPSWRAQETLWDTGERPRVSRLQGQRRPLLSCFRFSPKEGDSRLVQGALVTMNRSFGVRHPLIGCACDSNKCLMLFCLFSNVIYVTLGWAHLQDPWDTPQPWDGACFRMVFQTFARSW